MSQQRKPVSTKGKLILTSILGLIAAIIIINSLTSELNLRYIVRLAALLGLAFAMITVIFSNFPDKMLAIFGKNFMKMHHFFALAAVILITLHPVAFAIERLNPRVFIPDLSSWISFWELAGRPALYIFYIGIMAGILRTRLKKNWRTIHLFLYIAIFFVMVHATLIGRNFQNPAILVIFYVLFGIVVATPFYKRWRVRKRKKNRAQQAALTQEKDANAHIV